MCESDTVHSTNSNLYNTDFIREQVVVDSWTLDIDDTLSIGILANTKAQLSCRILTKDVDIEFCGRGVVDDG